MAEPLPIKLMFDLAGPREGVRERVERAVAAHPQAAGLLEPLGERLVDADITIAVITRRGGRRVDLQGLVGPGACVLVTPTHPGSDVGVWQVGTATAAPRLVAGAIGLSPRGPHPHPGVELSMPTGLVNLVPGDGGLDWPAGVEAEVDACLRQLETEGLPIAAARAILSKEAYLWSCLLLLPDETTAAAVVSGIDTPDHGFWLPLEAGRVTSLLTAASPARAWRLLCHIFAREVVPVVSV